MEKISIVMPVYNGETTLEKTLESLILQEEDFFELVIVNDASADGSLEIINNLARGRENWIILSNEHNRGLARSYNEGIRRARGDLVVTMHQDIVLTEGALKKLVAPFADKNVVAAGHADIHPLALWQKYNFWQKCFFSRFQKLDISGVNGQFDAFRKSALEKVGMFDGVHFKSAGEDGDIVYKMKKIGKVVASDARTVHLHKVDPHFGWKDIVHKQKQYSEAQGVLLRRGRISGIFLLAKSFFREILLIALIIPYIRILSVSSIILYSFLYTKLVYMEEYSNIRIVVLPFFNIFLLLVSLAYSLKGFILGRQTI
jgi:glycosyltransferase involved in cell wall biosynthesis